MLTKDINSWFVFPVSAEWDCDVSGKEYYCEIFGQPAKIIIYPTWLRKVGKNE